MLWDRKRLLGYVETIQLILRVTDKQKYSVGTEPYLGTVLKVHVVTYIFQNENGD